MSRIYGTLRGSEQTTALRLYREAASDSEPRLNIATREWRDQAFIRREDESQQPRAMDYLLLLLSGVTDDDNDLSTGGTPRTVALWEQIKEGEITDLPADVAAALGIEQDDDGGDFDE